MKIATTAGRLHAIASMVVFFNINWLMELNALPIAIPMPLNSKIEVSFSIPRMACHKIPPEKVIVAKTIENLSASPIGVPEIRSKQSRIEGARSKDLT